MGSIPSSPPPPIKSRPGDRCRRFASPGIFHSVETFALSLRSHPLGAVHQEALVAQDPPGVADAEGPDPPPTPVPVFVDCSTVVLEVLALAVVRGEFPRRGVPTTTAGGDASSLARGAREVGCQSHRGERRDGRLIAGSDIRTIPRSISDLRRRSLRPPGHRMAQQAPTGQHVSSRQRHPFHLVRRHAASVAQSLSDPSVSTLSSVVAAALPTPSAIAAVAAVAAVPVQLLDPGVRHLEELPQTEAEALALPQRGGGFDGGPEGLARRGGGGLRGGRRPLLGRGRGALRGAQQQLVALLRHGPMVESFVGKT
ncbi:hypothetical protein ACHAWF_001105 [Thalassiosira exigua]